jgi:hypothetical protein
LAVRFFFLLCTDEKINLFFVSTELRTNTSLFSGNTKQDSQARMMAAVPGGHRADGIYGEIPKSCRPLIYFGSVLKHRYSLGNGRLMLCPLATSGLSGSGREVAFYARMLPSTPLPVLV